MVKKELVRKKSEHNERLIGTLEELSLHQEDIECIEHLHNWCRDLRILLLQSNLISRIENLFKLKKLEYLNLAVNNIERVENLDGLESLNKLDLTLNFIGELTSVESLRGNYNLRELILTGNPCSDYPHYREYVIATLPQLTSLDCQPVTRTHQLQARPLLSKYKAIIVQKQAEYAMERDDQKIRFQQQKDELEARMAEMDDEDERIKMFWDSKSEHCPEIRSEIAKYHRQGREKHEPTDSKHKIVPRKTPPLFAACGRPYNLNQAKLPFTFKDERTEYILELGVYKFLDTSQIQVDVESAYVRVTVKGKIFQITFSEEVKTPEASVQRSQITGELRICVPKLKPNETLLIKAKDGGKAGVSTNGAKNQRGSALKGTVDIAHICSPPSDLPALIDAD